MFEPDIFEPAFQRDPYPAYARLRAELPVYREPRFGSYLLTRFPDVYGALRDHATFSSARGISPRSSAGGGMTIITSDPPRHTHLRQIVNRAFTPRTVATLRPRIETIVRDLMSNIEGEHFDLVHAVSYPLPVIVIAELLGIPPEDREQFKRWSDALVGTFDGDPTAVAQEGVEMFGYFSLALARRRAEPANDLLTALLNAEVDGERLNDVEVIFFAIIILVAGNETTTNLLANLVNVLADDPPLWRQLRTDRSLWPAAIEETLRIDSPAQLLGRTTTREVTIHETAIPAGARVLVSYGSANRDESEFAEPDVFRLDRNLSRHLAFGHGIHYCLGAPLARAEAEAALNALLDAFESVERAGAGTRTESTVIRGFEHLPLRGTRA